MHIGFLVVLLFTLLLVCTAVSFCVFYFILFYFICLFCFIRHEERQFHVFNQVQMAVEALKSKLAAPPKKAAAEAAAAAGAAQAAAAKAAGTAQEEETAAAATAAGEEAAAAAAAAEALEPDPNELLRQRAAELLHDEIRELGLSFFCFLFILYI